MASTQLCDLCHGLNVEALSQPEGYQHVATLESLRQNANTCPMCQILSDAIGNREIDPQYKPGPLNCRLKLLGDGEHASTALEVTGEQRQALVRVYTIGRECDPTSDGSIPSPITDCIDR